MGEQLGKQLAEPRRATRLIRLPEVMSRVGLGRSTIYRWMSEGKFPKPVQLGGHAVAWEQEKIDAWISSRLSDVVSEQLEREKAGIPIEHR